MALAKPNHQQKGHFWAWFLSVQLDNFKVSTSGYQGTGIYLKVLYRRELKLINLLALQWINHSFSVVKRCLQNKSLYRLPFIQKNPKENKCNDLPERANCAVALVNHFKLAQDVFVPRPWSSTHGSRCRDPHHAPSTVLTWLQRKIAMLMATKNG